MILAATGHRPDKLGGYGAAAVARVDRCALAWVTTLGPERVISGLALGWDQSIARAAIALGIPLTGAMPGYWQASKWPPESQREWRRILGHCDRIEIVTPGPYSAAAMQTRNAWMVDHADELLAMWDGSPGGTGNCVKDAQRRRPGMPIHRLTPAELVS